MRVYDKEFKKEAIKLSYEIGPTGSHGTIRNTSSYTKHMEKP